jgi:hypothetical protein
MASSTTTMLPGQICTMTFGICCLTTGEKTEKTCWRPPGRLRACSGSIGRSYRVRLYHAARSTFCHSERARPQSRNHAGERLPKSFDGGVRLSRSLRHDSIKAAGGLPVMLSSLPADPTRSNHLTPVPCRGGLGRPALFFWRRPSRPVPCEDAVKRCKVIEICCGAV